MSLKVETIDRQIIKPSSPTPENLFMQLSSLDYQPDFITSPVLYNAMVLFYADTSITDRVAARLKSSLARALAQFYPLAGRIRMSPSGTLRIECDDAGVEFVEAETCSGLDSYLKDPCLDSLTELLPIKSGLFRWDRSDPLLAVQYTAFGGSGFALGIDVSHMVADMASVTFFVNRWAELARGIDTVEPRPRFDSAVVFPLQPSPADRAPPPPMRSDIDNRNRTNRLILKRFSISARALRRLREGRKPAPTRVEAVTALLWRIIARARGKAVDMKHVVNLRRKMSLQLSDHSFGNLIAFVAIRFEDRCEAITQHEVEAAIRSTVASVNEESVRRRDWTNLGFDCFSFSSLCRLPWYRTDFGWGEPEWVGCGLRAFKEFCVLNDTKDGDGVEVWLSLDVDEMERIEEDCEFMDFTSS